MNIIEERDFINSYRDEELKSKLESRAAKSEEDIKAGRILTRAEVERRTALNK